MFDNTNNYTLRKEVIAGFTHYYVSFEDGTGKQQETEVPRTVYLEFLRFVKQERTLRRRDERYMEQSRLPPEVLHEQVMRQAKSAEDTVLDDLRAQELHKAIAELPRTQRRRLLLHCEYGLTYEQIAKNEGKHFTSVYESIECAKKKICEILKMTP